VYPIIITPFAAPGEVRMDFFPNWENLNGIENEGKALESQMKRTHPTPVYADRPPIQDVRFSQHFFC